ncbi:hypothetical protein EYC84_000329 [Monilinia fructicola]|uniref:Uncharacterized protein n=1 Tax=Monilinia fructicola TaxID=38448 RepID=A0A5M9JT28_MONFR|nr:hypothetical protein EYC84_000329 [Monilinia fructicola]
MFLVPHILALIPVASIALFISSNISLLPTSKPRTVHVNQTIQEPWFLFLCFSAHKSDYTDDAIEFDGFEGFVLLW